MNIVTLMISLSPAQITWNLPSLFSLTDYILGVWMTQSCGHAKVQQPCGANETALVGIHSVPIKLHHCYQVQSTKESQM